MLESTKQEHSPHKCSHCQRLFPLSKLTSTTDASGNDVYFCCNGCEGVYRLLHKSGFGIFYERLGDVTLTPLEKKGIDFSYLDEPSFLEQHTKQVSGLNEVSLIIDGIHCAACIWLNEHILSLQNGIKKVHINYTNNKAKILFDCREMRLSSIFSLIESIGYAAHIYNPQAQEEQLARTQRSFFISFVVGVFCTMSIMMVAIAQYVGYFYGMQPLMKDVLNLISCLLAIPVLLYTGRVFFSGAYYGLKQGYIGMDFLVAFGASLTMLYSIYASITRNGESYFESVVMIILFVFSGKFLEMRARRVAGDSLDRLHSILPSSVRVERQGLLQTCGVQDLHIGDRVHIPAGEMLPCDGVACGDALLDMRSLSGESLPVHKKSGEELLSGSIALERSLVYDVRKRYGDSTMSRIITLLEESLSSAPRIQNLANHLAKYFSRVVLFISLCGFVYWWVDSGVDQALIVTISVIVIACPCALALATPIASVVGISRAYKAGLVFKEARFLEVLACAKVVVFDKTGTLTNGVPKVQHMERFGDFDANVLAHFVRHSAHPISVAVAECFSTTQDVDLGPIIQSDSRGIRADYMGVELLGGSVEFLCDNGVAMDASVIDSSVEVDYVYHSGLLHDKRDIDSMSVFGYGVGGELKLLCYVLDEPKHYARELIRYLHKSGKRVVLLSGDRVGAVESVAHSLGIEEFHSGLLPAQKAQYIQALQQSLRTHAPKIHKDSSAVVMIGDGLNDTVALNNAEVGISMGAGSDIAIAQSDVIVLDDSLASVQMGFIIARQTYRRIYQNLAISLAYNALLIPLALCGFVIPLIAALSMSASSLLVVGNSLRKGANHKDL